MKKIYLLLFVFLFASQLFPQISQRSIEDALNKDGRIKEGVSGSFSGKGYKLSYGRNGEPILKKESPNKTQSITWSPMGQIPGANDQVHAVAVDSSGNVYIGGEFGWPYRSFAKWDGNAWSSMGDIDGTVNAIAINGTDIYVGGSFNIIDGNTSIKHIAKWNGSSWSALGTEFTYNPWNVSIRAITISGSDVYVGGEFTIYLDSLHSIATSHIAKWNGSSWLGVGGGVDQTCVYSLVADSSGNIYAGGDFLQAGSIPANRIAMWNGTNWSALGSGLDNVVYTVAVDDSGNVYAGGTFSQAGGNTAKRIAKWDGTSWSELGGGVIASYGCISSILLDGTDIYVGGDFSNIGGNGISNIAKWNGTSWSELSSSISGSNVNSLAKFNSEVYVGGNFTTAGDILGPTGVVAYNIVKWDGINWIQMGEGPTNQGGLTGEIFAVAVDGTDIYFGGRFTQAGGINANYIVKWDGSNWIQLGDGVNGYVYAIAVNDANVYVGGGFFQPGSNIARWAKPNELEPSGGWHALYDGVYQGVNGEVRAIVLKSDGVYVGGFFTSAATNSANYIAKWDGTTWSGLVENYNNGVNDYVHALDVNSAGDLFVGGEFTQAGGKSANRIAKWDGTNWSALGDGLSDIVYDIEANDSTVYACGGFLASGSTDLFRVAKWDGTNWSPLGTGLAGNECYAIIEKGGYVYVGGQMCSVGIDTNDSNWFPGENLARWDGTTWSAVGDGTIGAVNALAVSTSERAFYCGGNFISLGDYYTGAAHAARFTDSENIFPVEFTSFSANVLDSSVALYWETTAEINKYVFEVERASLSALPDTVGEKKWETIDVIEGHGNSNSPNYYEFIDETPLADSSEYRVKLIYADGKTILYSQTIKVNYSTSDVIEEIPAEFSLSQNYPNPFNPSTTIKYGLREAVNVQLTIYNMLGQKIATLVNKHQNTGNYSVHFDASSLSSGAYIYKIAAGNFVSAKKFLLLK